MTELLDIGEGEIVEFGFEERNQASALKEEVDQLLDEIHGHEKKLGSSYIKLGRLLGEVDRQRAWMPWGYTSLAGYITSIEERIGRKRSQIFEMVACAEKLLPQIAESDLEAMGISRASLLKKFTVQSQRRVTPELLAAALDGSIKLDEFQEIVYNNLNQEQEPKGTWRSIGFFAEPFEWEEIKQAKALVPVNGNLSDQKIWKETLLAWAREFYGTYVNNPENGQR